MNHINELSSILKKAFNWHKARTDCLAQILCGIISVKSVNLAQVALAFQTSAKASSAYRRIQRFFAFRFDPGMIAEFILHRLPKRKFHLLIDRTNWSFGQTHFNFLIIAVAYKEIAIPVYWVNLAKSGTSKADHRIFAVIRSCVALGIKNIQYLIADREFIGREWLAWLYENNIDFIIRIKGNMQLKRSNGSMTNARSAFSTLALCKKRRLREPLYLEHIPLFLSASRNPEGELLIVACTKHEPKALAWYKRRWEIETLFSSLKSKGLDLEQTHVTDPRRAERLLFVVVLAFFWSYLLGIAREIKEPRRLTNQGRLRLSLFRYGYDLLRRACYQNGLSEYVPLMAA